MSPAPLKADQGGEGQILGTASAADRPLSHARIFYSLQVIPMGPANDPGAPAAHPSLKPLYSLGKGDFGRYAYPINPAQVPPASELFSAVLDGQAELRSMLAELLDERRREAEPTEDDRLLLLEIAGQVRPGEPTNVTEILEIARGDPDLGAALDRVIANGRGRPNRLGLWLERMQRHEIDHMRLRRLGKVRGSNGWAIDLVRE